MKITNKTFSEIKEKDTVLEFPDQILTNPKCSKCYFNMESFILRHSNGKIYIKHVCGNCLYSIRSAYVGDINQKYLDDFLKIKI